MKPVTKSKKFKWTKNKIEIAKELSEGIKTGDQIAHDHGVAYKTIWDWKQHSEFLEKIDELTIAHERGTVAGLLRELYKGLKIKSELITDDKGKHIDYIKEIGELKGHKKQRTEGTITHIIQAPELRKLMQESTKEEDDET
jgi:hypothetical protein